MAKTPGGWFYSEKYRHYQKVNKGVYVYITRTLAGWQAQLYFRGEMGYCELEVRTPDRKAEGFLKMLVIAEDWLEKYADGDREKVRKDRFHVFNPNGVWADHEKKEYIV